METNPCTDCVENQDGHCAVHDVPVGDTQVGNLVRPDECKSYAVDRLAAIRAQVEKWRDEAMELNWSVYSQAQINGYNHVLDLIDKGVSG